jgi:ribonuclease HI
MPPPKNQKEVRGFLGRLNYIGRFISQLTSTCEPIFKLLRKGQPCEWNEECQAAFDKIKEYLKSPPVLMPPVPNRPLLLYVTVHEESMGALLAQHDDTGKKERAIYYLSKKFNDCEIRYSSIEKTCCAVAWVAQRLRHYLQSHTTWLISKMDPIKYIFEKPYLSNRIARWQALLSQYDIVYLTQKAIKGSVIADMLADQPINDYEPAGLDFPDEDILATLKENEGEDSDNETWVMRFDGALNSLGKGVGAVLISPGGKHYPVAAKLKFKCTNNVAEYEACALGIKMALDMKIKKLMVYGDSSLIIHQLQNEWNTRDPKLTPYYDYLSSLISKFDEIHFDHVPREQNQIVDALAT